MSEEDVTLKLGQRALERGLISSEQLYAALEEQTRDAATGKPRRTLPEILLDKGYVKEHQLVGLVQEHQPAVAGPVSRTMPLPLGKYAFVRELGRGGMGVVYEAEDRDLGRRVALKMLLTSPNADAVESQPEEDRFLREAKLTARLPKHPNIVSVYEAGILDGKRYLAMELIEGQSFSKWRKGGQPPLRQQIEVLRDVARAVHHAHGQGVVHRDLKPDNILLDGQLRPHVTDFGLAKSVGQDVSLSLTATGMVIGTPAYMSPEQALGLKSADHRTDLYAIGVMLYEILTGKQPFTGDTALEILLKASKNPVPTPSSIMKAGVDKTLERICIKCLSKEPRDRYESAGALADDLTGWLNGEKVTVALAPSTGRRVLIWIVAAAAGVALAAGISRMRTQPPEPPVQVPGLVAHWKLTDAAGLRRVGGVQAVQDGLRFDGVNGHVEIADTAALDRLRAGSSTIAVWFRPEEVPAKGSGYRLLSTNWGGLSFLDEGEFMAQYRAPGRVLVGVSTGNGPHPPGVWYHVVGVVDQAESVVIPYVNGQSRWRKPIGTAPAGTTAEGPWRIGIHHPGDGQWRWAAKGTIGSVRVYDRALSAAEIEALYRSELPSHQ